jgi:hypothetical protein
MFLHKNAPPREKQLSMAVLHMQNDYFSPIGREAFKALVDDSVLQTFEANYRPFPLNASALIRKQDVGFFNYIIKLDTRRRPTAGFTASVV